MPTMSDYQMPKFPSFKPMATPEEMKEASEKVMNFWVGALSPMWVPFWAATSFGMGAWAMTQSLGKTEDLMKDVPLAAKWPGFSGKRAAEDAVHAAEKTETAGEKTETAVEKTETAVEKAVEPVKATADAVVEDTGSILEDVPAKISEPVVEVIKAAPKSPLKPAVAKPTVAKPAVPKPAVAKAVVAKPAIKVEPKPIAKAVSAIKKPKATK